MKFMDDYRFFDEEDDGDSADDWDDDEDSDEEDQWLFLILFFRLPEKPFSGFFSLFFWFESLI